MYLELLLLYAITLVTVCETTHATHDSEDIVVDGENKGPVEGLTGRM